MLPITWSAIAAQGAAALLALGMALAAPAPVHYNDYEVFKSPLADFAREVKAA